MIAAMEAVVVAKHEWSILQMHKAKSPYKLMRRKSEAIPHAVGGDRRRSRGATGGARRRDGRGMGEGLEEGSVVVHPHRSCRQQQRLQDLPGAGEGDPGAYDAGGTAAMRSGESVRESGF